LPLPLEQEIRAIYKRSPLYSQRFPLHRGVLQWSYYREISILTEKGKFSIGHTTFFADCAEIERGFAGKKYDYGQTFRGGDSRCLGNGHAG